MTARIGTLSCRRVLLSPLGLALVSLGTFVLAALAPLEAQQETATILDKSGDNAATGAATRWDFGGTDMTFKAAKNEVWILDTYSNTVTIVNRFKADNLALGPVQLLINLPAEFADAPVLGIAEIPRGSFQGKNLVLIDPSFGTTDVPRPHVGVYEDDGNLAAGEVFVPIEGLDATVKLSSIDMNPESEEEEIAAYDMGNHAFYILDSTFAVKLGPIPVLGDPNGFINEWYFGSVDRTGLRGAGAGIAYDGPAKLLVNSAFYNSWETHFVLEYDLNAGGAYLGSAVDLSAAALSGLNPDIAFVAMDTGKVGAEETVFSLNVGDDSIYAFSKTLGQHATPVDLAPCGITADTGAYTLTWTLPAGQAVDSIRIVENGAEVATLPPGATDFTSPLPLLGKAFLEVATEKGGLTSGIRSVCQVEDSRLPPLPDVQFDAAQITSLGSWLSGVAVTKTPATPEEFRGYVIGQSSNDVEVFDYKLTVLPAEKLILNPRVVTPQGSSNLSAIGVTILKIDGEDHLAVLDPDGPQDNNVPSAMVFALQGVNRGRRVKDFNPIDLTGLSPTPFLFDWDTGPDQNLVAGGQIPSSGEFVLVRILNQGDSLVGTQVSPVPQRLLTPFTASPLTGIGVSVLPSGNILVAGSDTFSKTYTEALLMTPFFDGDVGAGPDVPKFVGYPQGLLVSNQFFAGMGPGIGPDVIFGLDTAYFPPPPESPEGTPGVGVTYVPTGLIFLIANPAAGLVLITTGSLLIHGENKCSHPDLVTEQLADVSGDVPPGESAGTGVETPSFAPDVSSTDYFIYVINQSETDPAKLSVEVKLDGAIVPDASPKITLPAGRYLRRALFARAEERLQVDVKNDGTAPAKVRILSGAMAIGKHKVPGIPFRRGDCDGNGLVNITDAIVGLNFLFKGGAEPACPDTADVDDDGKAGLTDMVVIVNHLFKAGPPPAAPGPDDCGVDPTDDTLADCVYTCP